MMNQSEAYDEIQSEQMDSGLDWKTILFVASTVLFLILLVFILKRSYPDANFGSY